MFGKSWSQVRWMKHFKILNNGFSRSYTTKLVKLENRRCISLIGVQPEEEVNFLQAITTNDTRHLDHASSQYTLLLNTRGRLIADCILYAPPPGSSIILDCHSSTSAAINKHLSVYNIRKKVKIEPKDSSVWALFSDNDDEGIPEITKQNQSDFFISRDPRLSRLGYRIVAPSSCSEEDLIQHLKIESQITKSSEYEYLRYKLGIGEGPVELSSGNSFPLECNGDYLHGISFHKGCYIGQELTARTYHTGVIRKRIMPLVFDSPPGDIAIDAPIYTETDPKSSVGKFRGISKDAGIALLRIAPALAASTLVIDGFKAKTLKPSWWPIEAPKGLSESS